MAITTLIILSYFCRVWQLLHYYLFSTADVHSSHYPHGKPIPKEIIYYKSTACSRIVLSYEYSANLDCHINTYLFYISFQA